MHAASEPIESETAALKALSARLNPVLISDLTCGGLVLSVRNRNAPILGTTVVVTNVEYAAEIGHGEPPVTLAPTSDPDAAAERVNRMLATVQP